MAERYQTRDLERAPAIRPAATPVDTYSRPALEPVHKADMGLGGLADLADALKSVEPSIQRHLVKRHEEVSEEEMKAGAAARLENQTAFRDAVAKGIIPEGASPWFLKGYQTQEGRIDGMEFDLALRTAWNESEVKNSDDPRVMTDWMGKFRAEFIKSKGQSGSINWQDGFAPMMNRAETTMSAQHIGHRQEEVSRKVRENTYREVSALIDNHTIQTREVPDMAFDADGHAASLVSLGGVVSERLGGLVRNGLNGADANKLTVDAIVTKAVNAKDTRLLNLLDHIKTGSGQLGGTAYAREHRLEAETRIERETKNDISWSHTLESWATAAEDRKFTMETLRPRQKLEWERADESYNKKHKSDAVAGQMITDAILNPTKEPDPAALTKLAGIDYRDAAFVSNWIQAFRTQSKNIEDDPNVVNQIVRDMALNPEKFDVKRVFAGVPNRQFGTSTMLRLYNEWQQQKAQDAKDPLLKDPDFARAVNALGQAVKGSPTGEYGAGALDAEEAQSKLIRRARLWKQENPQGTATQFQEWTDKTKRDLAKDYNEIVSDMSKSVKDADKRDADAAKQQQEKVAAGRPQPPQEAIKFLTDNPDTYGDFDKTFGEGAAESVLTGASKAQQKTKPAQPKKFDPEDVKALLSNPGIYRRFDKVYGEGAAARAIQEDRVKKSQERPQDNPTRAAIRRAMTPAQTPVSAPVTSPASKNQYHFPKGTAERTRLDAVSPGGDFDALTPADKDRIFKAMFPEAAK